MKKENEEEEEEDSKDRLRGRDLRWRRKEVKEGNAHGAEPVSGNVRLRLLEPFKVLAVYILGSEIRASCCGSE